MRILYKKFVYSITLSKVSQLFNLIRSSTSLIKNVNYEIVSRIRSIGKCHLNERSFKLKHWTQLFSIFFQ